MSDRDICIYDFAGNHDHPGCWADILCEERMVTFGGLWEDVPILHLPEKVTVNQAIELASARLRAHGFDYKFELLDPALLV